MKEKDPGSGQTKIMFAFNHTQCLYLKQQTRLASTDLLRRQPKLKRQRIEEVQTTKGRLSIARVKADKEIKPQEHTKVDVFPTVHIKDLNFPKEHHEAYHAQLAERRASVGALSAVVHSGTWHQRFVLILSLQLTETGPNRLLTS